MSQIIAPSVLIVEKDLDVSGIARQALEAFLAAEVQISANAEYGFELALRSKFDLYLFSLSLGGFDGDQLHRLIWAAHSSGHFDLDRVPPVIWLADPAVPAKRIREAMQQPGARGVLKLPLSLDAIVSRVGAALSLGEAWALA